MGRAKSNPPLGGSCSLFCRIVNSYNNQQHQQLDPVQVSEDPLCINGTFLCINGGWNLSTHQWKPFYASVETFPRISGTSPSTNVGILLSINGPLKAPMGSFYASSVEPFQSTNGNLLRISGTKYQAQFFHRLVKEESLPLHTAGSWAAGPESGRQRLRGHVHGSNSVYWKYMVCARSKSCHFCFFSSDDAAFVSNGDTHLSPLYLT